MRSNDRRKWIRFFAVFFSSVSICFLAGASLVKSKQELEQIQMERLVLTKSNKLNEVLSKLLSKTQILAVLVMQNQGKIGDFEQLAATVVDDPAIKNVLSPPAAW